MGRMIDALRTREKDQSDAAKKNAKHKLRRGQKVKVYGEVYLQPGFEMGAGREAIIEGLNLPSTAEVRFVDTGTLAYADKSKLKPIRRNGNGNARKS